MSGGVSFDFDTNDVLAAAVALAADAGSDWAKLSNDERRPFLHQALVALAASRRNREKPAPIERELRRARLLAARTYGLRSVPRRAVLLGQMDEGERVRNFKRSAND